MQTKRSKKRIFRRSSLSSICALLFCLRYCDKFCGSIVCIRCSVSSCAALCSNRCVRYLRRRICSVFVCLFVWAFFSLLHFCSKYAGQMIHIPTVGDTRHEASPVVVHGRLHCARRRAIGRSVASCRILHNFVNIYNLLGVEADKGENWVN